MLFGRTISLILPCKNEAESLDSMLSKVPSFIDEVLVVDNASTDNTRSVVEKLNVKYISEPRVKNGIGYGFAHITGINKAKNDIIVCMDADQSYPLTEVYNIVKALIRQDLDFISCNRLPLTNASSIFPVRLFGIKLLNLMVDVIYGYKINDSLTGMWVFRKEKVTKLNLNEGGWNLSLEIKLKSILDDQINVAEYQINYNDRKVGSSKQSIFKTGFEHAKYLVSYKLQLIKAALRLPRTTNKLSNELATVNFNISEN